MGKLLTTSSTKKRREKARELREKARNVLRVEWARICALAEAQELHDFLEDPKLIKVIHDSVNGSGIFRYVLPTQLLAKVSDPSLDARCLQEQRKGPGAFDARSLAKVVIAGDFDQENESVLGGSHDPYVSNPLRVPELSAAYRGKRTDRASWDQLCFVVDAVEKKQDQKFTEAVFRQVLTEIYRRLATVRVVYGTPRRVSLKRALEVIRSFLSEHSGGDRLLALSSALFTIIGKRFGLYDKVRRANITASDRSTGMLADLECVTADGRIAFVVEVKDQQITISQLRTKLRTIREKRISEIFFVAQGTVPAEEADVEALIDREFTSGQNVYITDIAELSGTALAILGEEGRREFLMETANQLETYNSEITHRRAWAAIMQSI